MAVADLYRRFAELEARGVSDRYHDWATGVAGDPEVADLLETVPGPKRQPNLVFAAARAAGAPLVPYTELRGWLIEHWDAVRPIVLARSTQTNEAARCATLLPVLAEIHGPIALLEVGASAGLCLYPDRYSYRYTTPEGDTYLDPAGGPSAVELPCRTDADSVPDRLPEVVWRAGIDLSPIDVRDPGQVAWLDTLVWPEHAARRQRLRAAAELVAADPPRLVRGDLLEALPALATDAPVDATLVVFHSAVLVYLDRPSRERFVGRVRSLGATWLSNEGAGVVPGVGERLSVDPAGRFVLARDGVPVALTGPHGQSYEPLPE